MKTTARQTSARAPEAKERSRKTGSMPAQRLSVDPKAGAPVKRSDSKALPDMPMIDALAETSAPSTQELIEYQRDFFKCSILFWDTLRKRVNNMLEHERAGMPPLLDFKYETLLDARRYERPVDKRSQQVAWMLLAATLTRAPWQQRAVQGGQDMNPWSATGAR